MKLNNHLQTIRTMACCRCQAPAPSDAAHSNFMEHGKGRGIKADDRYTIPLCRKCHQWFDQYSEMNRDEAKAWFGGKLNFIIRVLRGFEEEPF